MRSSMNDNGSFDSRVHERQSSQKTESESHVQMFQYRNTERTFRLFVSQKEKMKTKKKEKTKFERDVDV